MKTIELKGWDKVVINQQKDCTIIEGHINDDYFITHGIYTQGPKKGTEWMEYYSGPNYKPQSKRSNSYSRYYKPEQIPPTFKKRWEELRQVSFT